jgi:hypothetical protein
MPDTNPTSLIDLLTTAQRRELHKLTRKHDVALVLTRDDSGAITAHLPDGPDVWSSDAR